MNPIRKWYQSIVAKLAELLAVALTKKAEDKLEDLMQDND